MRLLLVLAGATAALIAALGATLVAASLALGPQVVLRDELGSHHPDGVIEELMAELKREDRYAGVYVQSAQLSLSAAPRWKHLGHSVERYQLRSSDPAVLQVEPNSYAYSTGTGSAATAVGSGDAELQLVETSTGRVRGSWPVRVRMPDLLTVQPATERMVDPEAPPLQSFSALVGGDALFVVSYSAQGQALAGKGVLQTSGDARPFTHRLAGPLDLLLVSPIAPGPQELTLSVADQPLSTLQVRGVSAGQLRGLELSGPTESALFSDADQVLVAMGVGPEGEPVHGLRPSWSLSQEDLGVGQLFRFRYDGAHPQQLTASLGEQRGSAYASFQTGGPVDLARSAGCSTGAVPLRPPLFFALFMVLSFSRRQRQRPSPSPSTQMGFVKPMGR